VHLTGHEVDLAGPAVAVVAIVASVITNQLTNRNARKATEASNANALRIAREERITRLGSQIFKTRRTWYGR
jgi:hypothetical protein